MLLRCTGRADGYFITTVSNMFPLGFSVALMSVCRSCRVWGKEAAVEEGEDEGETRAMAQQ